MIFVWAWESKFLRDWEKMSPDQIAWHPWAPYSLDANIGNARSLRWTKGRRKKQKQKLTVALNNSKTLFDMQVVKLRIYFLTATCAVLLPSKITLAEVNEKKTFPRCSDRVRGSCRHGRDSSTRQNSAPVSWYPICWTSSRRLKFLRPKTG